MAAVASVDHGIERPRRIRQVERVGERTRVGDEQGTLAEVVEHQRRRGDAEPREAHGAPAEMSHVRVEGFRAGDREEYRAQHDEGGEPMPRREIERVARVERGQYRGRLGDVPHAHRAERSEPERADRAEEDPDHAGAVALDEEERHEDARGERHDVGLEGRGAHLEAFHGGEHRDRRREHRIAVEQRGAEHPARQQHGPQARVLAHRGGGEREQGHDPALAAIVRAQHQRHVLEGDHDHQRPEDRRYSAQDVLGIERDAVFRIERLLHRVERAGADVAVDHAQGEQRQGGGAVPQRGAAARRRVAGKRAGYRSHAAQLRRAVPATPAPGPILNGIFTPALR